MGKLMLGPDAYRRLMTTDLLTLDCVQYLRFIVPHATAQVGPGRLVAWQHYQSEGATKHLEFNQDNLIMAQKLGGPTWDLLTGVAYALRDVDDYLVTLCTVENDDE